MKKLVAAASALALTAGLTFGETHETLKAHTLSTSVGDISFGAWGRSTFEFGHKVTTKELSVSATALGTTAQEAVNAAVSNYATACTLLGTTAKDSTDDGYKADVISKAATAAVYQSAYEKTGDATAAQTYLASTEGQVAVAAVQSQLTDAFTASEGIALFKGMLDTNGEVKDTSNYAALNPDWSYGNRIGFWIIGRTPNQHFGFDFNLDADARALFVHKLWDANESADDVNYNEDGKYAVAIGDQAKMWGLFDTPFGLQNKVAFGKMREQTLRGTIGDFGQRESSDVKSEDDIMSEFWPTTGLYVSTTGQEGSVFDGFHLAAAVDLSGTLGTESWNGSKSTKSSATYTGYSAGDKNNRNEGNDDMPLYYAMRTAQVGVGYTIPGLAQVKAQYWGDSIASQNYRYETSKYKAAREAGFGMNDYYGRMEFGFDWLGFMGGATSFLDPKLDLEKTPNANLIEVGFKVPIVTDSDLRDYDPEKFYKWYSCIGTMGVIEKGFIMYKGHIWGGQGVSHLKQYTDVSGSGEGLLQMNKGDGADIFMAGVDFLTEVCINPFGKQDLFFGLSGNYNITSANADGRFTVDGLSGDYGVEDLKLRQHKFAVEVYFKKTFAANCFMFAGIAGNFSFQSMEGTVEKIADLSYKASSKKFYMPIGVELFF